MQYTCLVISFYLRNIYLANEGVPLFTQSLTYQIVLIIPIIAIEAYVHKKLLEIPIDKAFTVSCVTNIVSTVLGIFTLPIVGIFVGYIFFHTGGPVGTKFSFPFQPIEIIVTLFPLLWFSFVVESFIGIGIIADTKAEWRKVIESFLIANIFTYLMLEVLALTLFLKLYIQGHY